MTAHHLGSTADPATWPTVSVGTFRLHDVIQWAQVNPSNGVFDWSAKSGNQCSFDQIMSYIPIGTDIILTLNTFPRWACANQASGAAGSPLSNQQYLVNYVNAVAARAAGRIRYWEGMNEPDLAEFWDGSVAQLVTMQQTWYNAVKAVDPTFVVISPAPASAAANPSYLNSMIAAGIDPYVDVYGVHLYEADVPETVLKRAGWCKTAIASTGKGFMNTEASWGLDCQNAVGYPNQQAFVSRYLISNYASGAQKFVWYAWDNANFGTLYNETDSGKTPLGPTVAATAYQTMLDWMVGATVTVPLAADPTGCVWSTTLTKPGGHQAKIVWFEPLFSCNHDQDITLQWPSIYNWNGNTYGYITANSQVAPDGLTRAATFAETSGGGGGEKAVSGSQWDTKPAGTPQQYTLAFKVGRLTGGSRAANRHTLEHNRKAA